MIKLRNKYRSFSGWTEFYEHESKETGTLMRFSVYRPDLERKKPVPVLYWLSGLTCSEENFMQKSGAQKMLSEQGIMLLAPDTSPRNCQIKGEEESWSFGSGAGFYLDANKEPWSKNYRMFSYITEEIPNLVRNNFSCISDRQSIFGHSMGGHGALVSALRRPKLYRSVSAFAPICSPSTSPWGVHAFKNYLGSNQDQWSQYDSCKLIMNGAKKIPMLIDQGLEDEFLKEGQLEVDKLKNICLEKNYPAEIRMHENFDHSYYFVSSFIDEHIKFHINFLNDNNIN